MKNNFLSGNGGFYVARLGEITDYSHSTRVTEGSPSKVLQLLRQMSGKNVALMPRVSQSLPFIRCPALAVQKKLK